MKPYNDQCLLKQYHRGGSETAFTELVRRHIDGVYSTALRLLMDRHLAEDVVQQVFVALARHAHLLSRRPVLSGWLHRTTHNFAVMTIRREERRRAREQKVAAMTDAEPLLVTGEDNSWQQLSPHLDSAIDELSEADRDALALRFFDRKSAVDIAGMLGISEEAAQKRVQRALERLRRALAARGVTVPLVGLNAAMSANLVQATPGSLAQALVTEIWTAVAEGAVPATICSEVSHWLWAQPVTAAAAGLLVISLGTAGYLTGRAGAREHWRAVRWHNALAVTPSFEESRREPLTFAAAPRPAAVPSTEPVRPSVSEVMGAAADQFRNREEDLDAWAKGFVWMEQLRPEDVPEALRLLDNYRHETAVFASMAPLVIRVWAQSDPARALGHALTHFEEKNGLGLSIEFATSRWAEQNPYEAWRWYRETSGAGDPPIADASWMWVPKHIYGAWAAHDPAAAIRSLQEIPYGDQDNAIFGIAEAAREPAARPAILAAIGQVSDESQKRELARRLSSQWAKEEPAAAAEWVASLHFANPAAKLRVMGEVAEEWWPIDRPAVTQWLLANAPREVLSQVQAGLAEMTRRSNAP